MDEMEIDGAGAATATTSTMTSSVASGSGEVFLGASLMISAAQLIYRAAPDYTLYGNVMSMITALTHRARAVRYTHPNLLLQTLL